MSSGEWTSTAPPSGEAVEREAILFATVMDNPFIPHAPTGKQTAFLATFDREVLYGGAAGGGKTDALLMSALQFAEVSGYAALLLRRTFPELNQDGGIIPRSKDWLFGKAQWNAQEHRWAFPSGASLTFGYLDREDDRYRYQGAAYQFIGFDELTQFTEGQYRYLFSRLRRLEGSRIPLRMRAASNPGGVGHDWVKRRFLSDPEGRAFIPAKLEDNPHLDQAAYLESLRELDPITRAQLLAGDWDAHQGGRFKREWLRYYTRRGAHFWLGDRIYTEDEVRDRFLTVDTASTVKETSKDDPDWTVISAWGTARHGELVWLGCLRLRVEIPDIAPRIAEQYQRHRAQKARVEGGGTQKGVPQLARRQPLANGAFMNVVEVVPKGGDKLERGAELLNMAEAGRVWLPAQDPAFPLEEVEAELLRFTGDPKRDAHDDIWDTAADAANYAAGKAEAKRAGFTPYIMPVKGR